MSNLGVGPRMGGHEVAQALTDRLSSVYGSRLRRVILYGSWARDEASWQDSDVDLLVILDRVEDPRAEDQRIDPVAGDLFLEAGRPVIAFSLAEGELFPPRTRFLEVALREGIDFRPYS